MYVIFPADELIYMTYGAAVPRIKPRPTLDNLREPLVPPETRPSPSRTVVPVQSATNHNYNSNSDHNSFDHALSTATPIPGPSTSNSYPETLPFTNNPKNNHSNNSYDPPISTKIDLNNSNTVTSQSGRSREPSLTNRSLILSNHLDAKSDHFQIDDYERMIDYTSHDHYMRDRSPSIFLEPPSPEFPTPPSRPISPTPSGATSPKSPKTKRHPKLALALSRLGRKQPDLTESNRLREDLELKVTNPTFTRENLRQRNYDAFFESGEPVYSLAPKPHTTSDVDSPLTSEQHLAGAMASMSFETPNSASPRPRSLALFRSKSPGDMRSKSADYEGPYGAEVSQKETSKSSGGHRSLFGWKGRGGSLSPQASMASNSGVLKDYGHANYNEALKIHNGVTFKLVKTVSDFTETLSHLYEEHAAALQTLVSTYRKKNGDLRKERPACHSTLFHAWETFLQEIEADSQASTDVASTLSRQVSRPMLDRSFHRKVQSRKIFTHRESFETIIAKTEEKLSKCRLDYKQSYVAHRQNPTQLSLVQYIDAHNAYVQQLHATNAMLEAYHCETIPQLMQELEEVYADLCSIVAEAVLQGAEVISSKANEQARRYDGLSTQCKSLSPQQDLTNFVRILPQVPNSQKVPKKAFAPPQPQAEGEDPTDFNDNSPPPLRNELVLERNSSLQLRPSLESLKREAAELEIQIRQLQDTVDTLIRTQLRGIENQLYNKANELQEDLSMKKFDLRAKQIHFAAVRAQRELFLSKLDPGSPRGERKLSSSSSSSMKTKWLKAFRSLKPASGSAQPEKTNQMYHAVSTVLTLRRNGAAAAQSFRPNEDGSHNLQEYTYKKITPCDVCSQILRGHTRQGLRCRICKLNVHGDCAPQLPKCQAKQKLLRRQKSTSELENRVEVEEEKITEIDQIYRVLKQAGEISNKTNATEKAPGQGNVIISGGTGPGGAGGTGGRGAGDNSTTQQTRDQQQQQQTSSQQQSQQQQQQDIPIVNVPECPERVGGPGVGRRGVTLKPPTSGSGGGSQQQSQQQQSKGLTAPIQDVSSSDYRIPISNVTNQQAALPTAPVYTQQQQQQFQQQQLQQAQQQQLPQDLGLRRRLFAGFRPLSGFGRGRIRSSQHRSISLPETPHSPRRHKLNLRMKSLSLDSPESSELHGQIRRRHPAAGPSSSYYQSGSGGHLEHSTPPSNNSRLHSPSSPSHQRKLLYANRGLRTGSVDLPDDVEKSLSSASTSPCPSPKSHRLLPTNLYVILYNFKARHGDELDLKAGYKVTVIDTSDPDWWKGKCLGRIGYFPSKYCARLNAGEKPLQVTHNLQVSDGERGDNMTLLRDQIVIQVGEEVSGMVMVRSADNRQGVCPVKYLQEV